MEFSLKINRSGLWLRMSVMIGLHGQNLNWITSDGLFDCSEFMTFEQTRLFIEESEQLFNEFKQVNPRIIKIKQMELNIQDTEAIYRMVKEFYQIAQIKFRFTEFSIDKMSIVKYSRNGTISIRSCLKITDTS